jgi:putative peptidoglycan lipid II flippase
MGATVGLVASTQGRLYASALYALGDTKTPLRFAVVRVASGAALAAALVLWAPPGIPDAVRTAFLPAASGAAAWLEFLLLRRVLTRRVGEASAEAGRSLRVWTAALVAGAAALGLKVLLTQHFGAAPGLEGTWGGSVLPAPALHPIPTAALVLGAYGGLYFALAHALGLGEASAVVRRVLQRVRRR